MRVNWLALALDDLDSAIEFIAKENPAAAARVAQRIWNTSQSLIDHPEIGRPGRFPGSREKKIDQAPYLLVYRIRNNQIEIIRLLHSRQSWLGS